MIFGEAHNDSFYEINNSRSLLLSTYYISINVMHDCDSYLQTSREMLLKLICTSENHYNRLGLIFYLFYIFRHLNFFLSFMILVSCKGWKILMF